MPERFSSPVRAPAFPDDRDWIGGGPKRLEDFRGRLLILDFWTYGCINCQHVLPPLRQAEQEFGDRIAVVGVHAGKFAAERETARIAQAAARAEIDHPVVNDHDLAIWNAYSVRAWPTLVFVDRHGRVIGRHEGEVSFGELAAFIDAELAVKSDPGASPASGRRPLPDDGALRHPAGLAAGDDGLFVADTGHHRILLVDRTGRLRRSIGGDGRAGMRDGSLDQARFHAPHGLAAEGRWLFVADTGNHAVRLVDLEQGEVMTLAGTGRLAIDHPAGGPPRNTELRSPWAVAIGGDGLFIAMAGMHQIWRYDLETNALAPYAGSGYEALYDAALGRARFAQPMGLAVAGEELFVADAESSAVRRLPIGGRGQVTTIVGQGLFEFGDRDGPAAQALLQHVCGLAAHEQALFLADAYNDKVKRLDLPSGTVSTVLSDLAEPMAVAVWDRELIVCDTNSHRVLTMPLAGGPVTTLLGA